MKQCHCSNKDGFRDDHTKSKKTNNMIKLISGNIQINISTKQKQTHRYREQICGLRGKGVLEGRSRSLELAEANYYTQDDEQGPIIQHKEIDLLSCDKP